MVSNCTLLTEYYRQPECINNEIFKNSNSNDETMERNKSFIMDDKRHLFNTISLSCQRHHASSTLSCEKWDVSVGVGDTLLLVYALQ